MFKLSWVWLKLLDLTKIFRLSGVWRKARWSQLDPNWWYHTVPANTAVEIHKSGDGEDDDAKEGRRSWRAGRWCWLLLGRGRSRRGRWRGFRRRNKPQKQQLEAVCKPAKQSLLGKLDDRNHQRRQDNRQKKSKSEKLLSNSTAHFLPFIAQQATWKGAQDVGDGWANDGSQ